MAVLNLKYHRLIDVLAVITGASLFTYVLYRAIYIPLTPEEADLFMNHNARGNLFISSIKTSGNLQPLNILLIQLFTYILGISEWAIRLPNVLSLLLYLFFSYRILCGHPMYIRLIFWPVVWFIPVLIEMFGLGLGFGISIAFMIMGLYHVQAFLSQSSLKNFYWAQISLLASILANAQLYFPLGTVSLLLIVGALRVKKGRQYLLAGLFSLVALVTEGVWVFKVLNQGATHRFPDIQQLLGSTFKPLYSTVFYSEFIGQIHLGYFLVIGVFMVYCYVLCIVKHGLFRALRSKKLMLFHLFLLMVFAIMGSKYYLGIRLPQAENLIFMIPVLLFSLAGLADVYAKGSFSVVTTLVGIMLISLFPYRLLGTLSLSRAQHWGKQSIPESYFETVDFLGGNALINGPKYLETSWAYYNLKSKGDYNLMQWSDYPGRIADVVFWDSQFENENGHYYDTLNAYPKSKSYLLKRIRSIPFQTVMDMDSISTDALISEEFRNLLEYGVVELRSNVMRVDVEAEIESSAVPFDAEIVVSIEDDSATALIYEHYPLSWHHREWKEGQNTFKHSLYLKELPESSAMLKVYVWNPDKAEYRVSNTRITLLKYLFESNQ